MKGWKCVTQLFALQQQLQLPSSAALWQVGKWAHPSTGLEVPNLPEHIEGYSSIDSFHKTIVQANRLGVAANVISNAEAVLEDSKVLAKEG